jgi:hypothetical protein
MPWTRKNKNYKSAIELWGAQKEDSLMVSVDHVVVVWFVCGSFNDADNNSLYRAEL